MAFWIDTADAGAAPPAIPAAGTPGHWQARNFLAGTEATVVPPWFMEMVQNELTALPPIAGIACSKTDSSQNAQAVMAVGRRLGAANWTPLTGVAGGATVQLSWDNLGMVIVEADAGPLNIILPPASCLGVLAAAPKLWIMRLDRTPANAVNILAPSGEYFGPNFALLNSTNLMTGEMLSLYADESQLWYAYRHGARALYAFGNPAANGTSANTFTARVGCFNHGCQIGGAGGAGGDGPLSVNAGGSGGGAGMVALCQNVPLVPGIQQILTVGAPGAPPASPTSQGGRGGSSSLGSLITVTGGYGGFGAEVAPSNSGGVGAGSAYDPFASTALTVAAGLDVLGLPGGQGGDGSLVAGVATGYGGVPALFGGGSRAANTTIGFSDGSYCSGGGGAYGTVGEGGTGSPGNPGLILLWENQ